MKPGTNYRLSCWIYAQGIETPSIGANISVLGATVAAGDLRDTGGKWQLVELYGKTGPQQQAIAVLARLGFYGSLATGLALFDDFTVEELAKPPAGKVVANLDTTEMVVVQSLPPTPSGEERPALAAAPRSPSAWLRTLFTPPWLYLVVTVLGTARARGDRRGGVRPRLVPGHPALRPGGRGSLGAHPDHRAHLGLQLALAAGGTAARRAPARCGARDRAPRLRP